VTKSQEPSVTPLRVGIADIQAMALVGGALCLDFTNTITARGSPGEKEYLCSSGHLLAWGRRAGIGAEIDLPETLPAALLPRAKALREALHVLFAGGDALTELNAWLAPALGHRRLGPGYAWRWVATADPARILWPVALSAAELLASGDAGKVRACAGEGCGWLFLDRSKNRSRRWCEMAVCGNRAKARARRARAQVCTGN
jgi:predicted RNA-binding Zn ribbon-like protein